LQAYFSSEKNAANSLRPAYSAEAAAGKLAVFRLSSMPVSRLIPGAWSRLY
jgi:hypothetical protein